MSDEENLLFSRQARSRLKPSLYRSTKEDIIRYGVKYFHIFLLNREKDQDWHLDIHSDDVLDELSKFGGIVHIHVDQTSVQVTNFTTLVSYNISVQVTNFTTLVSYNICTGN